MSLTLAEVNAAPDFETGMDPAIVSWQKRNGRVINFGEDLAELRKKFSDMLIARFADVPVNPGVSITESSVPTSMGDITVRVFTPSDPIPGTIVFYHGGGWVLGNLDTHDAPCRQIASLARMRVVSVDYPLAPEHRFNQIRRAAIDVASHYAQDTTPILVAGDSAGGHLAAVVAQASLTEPFTVAAQLLFYPVTDLELNAPALTERGRSFPLTTAQMHFYRDALLGEDATNDAITAASPLHQVCAGLPPAVVTTAEFDPLRDDGARYAARLAEHQVPVAFLSHPTLVHGWLDWFGISQTASDALVSAVSAAQQFLIVDPAEENVNA